MTQILGDFPSGIFEAVSRIRRAFRVMDGQCLHLPDVTNRTDDTYPVREINRQQASQSLSHIVRGETRRLPGHGRVLLAMTAVDDRGFTHFYEPIEVPLESVHRILSSMASGDRSATVETVA